MSRCQICNEPGATFCSNFVACNERARLRLGIPAWQVRRERGRDLQRYARANGAGDDVLPPISEPPTSEILRKRVLAALNGAPSAAELREIAKGAKS